MFQSLISRSPGSRPILQPAVSLAVHAGLLAMVWTTDTNPTRDLQEEPPKDEVIYIPELHPTGDKVSPQPPVSGPAPACACPMIVPGQLPVSLPPVLSDSLPTRIFQPGGDRPGSGGDGDGESIGEPSVYEVRHLSEAPRMMRFTAPPYPPALRGAGVEGSVVAEYVVDARGDVEPESIAIVSSDHPLMAQAVRAAVVTARFHPGMIRGEPVRTRVRQVIRFSLMSL